MAASDGDFALTSEELREVARYVCSFASDVLPVFELNHPDDGRPREALAAGLAFADGQPRSRWQRTASMEAHRAAAEAGEAGDERGRLAAQAAGDAASAAYLHPIAKAHQVAHILRAPANAARIAQLTDDAGPLADAVLEIAAERATPMVIDILCRYPSPAPGTSPPARLMSTLDVLLRSER